LICQSKAQKEKEIFKIFSKSVAYTILRRRLLLVKEQNGCSGNAGIINNSIYCPFYNRLHTLSISGISIATHISGLTVLTIIVFLPWLTPVLKTFFAS
jgi:hypothetical protein